MLSFRRVTLSALVFFMTFILTPIASFSQPSKKLGLLIEKFEEAELKCRLNSEDIKSSISLIMKQNGILLEDSVYPYFYLNVGAIEINDINCAISLSLSLITYRPKTDHSGFSVKNFNTEEVRLCDDGKLLVFAKSKIAKKISDDVEILTKRCLSSIEY